MVVTGRAVALAGLFWLPGQSLPLILAVAAVEFVFGIALVMGNLASEPTVA